MAGCVAGERGLSHVILHISQQARRRNGGLGFVSFFFGGTVKPKAKKYTTRHRVDLLSEFAVYCYVHQIARIL